MKASFIIIGLLSIVNANAGEHALGAHEHGSIKLNMAVEKNIVEFDIDGPSESFIGFEYLPKTEKEKKVFATTKNLWEKNFFSLVSFDKSLNCKLTESKFVQVVEGSHSDIEASAKITCAKNVEGTNVEVALRKYFKNIKKLNIEVLSGEAKNVEITKPVQSFKI